MHVMVCLDNNNGMAFNHRRQSRDREVTADILKTVGSRTLWITDYSKSLFEQSANIKTDETPWERADTDEFVLLEQTPVNLEKESIDTLTVYRWNRVYPADICFDIPKNWKRVRMEEFAGYSHEKITKEIYRREDVGRI